MYAHDLRAPTNPFRPQDVGYCERCNFKWYHSDLTFQHDWRGNALVSLNILVCPRCADKPQEQLRPIIIGPDGLPPRPRPAPGHLAQQMAGTGSTAPATVAMQRAVLSDAELV